MAGGGGEQRAEIAGIAGEAGKAEHGGAGAGIVIGQREAVGGGETVHAGSASLARAGIEVRSGRMCDGVQGRRSTGSEARLTQAVVKP